MTRKSVSLTVTVDELKSAFTEWDRRYREDPQQFESEAYRLLKETPETYGGCMRAVFRQNPADSKEAQVMSQDFPDRKKWLAIRETPANLHRRLGRLVFAGGTYVRPQGTDNARLDWYEKQCNGNARRRATT